MIHFVSVETMLAIEDGDCQLSEKEIIEQAFAQIKERAERKELEFLIETEGDGEDISTVICKKCGTNLDSHGFCYDETCPYFDYLQNEEFTEG